MLSLRENKRFYRYMVTLGLALAFLMASSAVAHAEKELFDDLPTKTTIGGYTIEYLKVANNNYAAGQNYKFNFKVSDNTGKPIDKLDLKFTAVRDYSGQVKKEHNGPRDPLVGPVKLVATSQAGEYTTAETITFSNNGQWRFYVDSESFGTERAKFTQAVAINSSIEAGVGLDWLLYPTLVATVISVVLFIGSKGVRYFVPAAELAGANERRK